MNSRLLINLLLGGIAVALVLIIIYRPGQETPAPATPLTTLAADNIQRISVSRQQLDPLEFIRTGHGWFLESPRRLPASEFQIRALLEILSAQPGRSYPDTSMDLADAGLQPPQATLQLADSVFHIGNTMPLDKRRYIRYNDQVHLLTDRYQHLVNAKWSNFVDRHLLPTGASLRAIQLPDMTLLRDNEKNWHLENNLAVFDTDTLQSFVNRWQMADATYLRAYDGTASNGSITLTLNGGEIIELVILKREPELVLARPDWGIQYYFPEDASRSLLAITTAESKPESP